ncbi:MAG: hypothetical protein KF699_09385 [Phycisphaeraceae bacterium]|nr:hypothetical protein [Phycisphaeraceae bacterium]MBX3408224.1 hypothetical protein [Phycisphaeraceae bacterium]
MVEKMFPRFRGGALEVRAARLDYVAQTALRLSLELPKQINLLRTAQAAHRRAREVRARYDEDPGQVNGPLMLALSDQLYASSEREILAERAVMQEYRELWLWLREAVRATLVRLAPQLVELSPGQWSGAPSPDVFGWLAAVRIAAFRGASDLREGIYRFEQPVSLKAVCEQVGKRIDLVHSKLERNGRVVAGMKRDPVAELEDVVEACPEHAHDLRRLFGPGSTGPTGA